MKLFWDWSRFRTTTEQSHWFGRSGQRKWRSRIRIVAMGIRRGVSDALAEIGKYGWWSTGRVYLTLFSSLESSVWSLFFLALVCIYLGFVALHLRSKLNISWPDMYLVRDGRRINSFSNQVTAALNEIDVISGDKWAQGKGGRKPAVRIW